MPHELLSLALEHLRGGGWVMVPLAVVSIAMWFLVLRSSMRCMALNRSARPLSECLDGASMATWQSAMLDGFRQGRTGEEDLDRRFLDSLAARELEIEDRRVGTILLLAGMAPLLGLLGTVGGMIATFDTILQFGTGNARGLASGISSALITTQTGLVVAVPGLVAGCVLRRRLSRLRERAVRFGLGLQDVFCLEHVACCMEMDQTLDGAQDRTQEQSEERTGADNGGEPGRPQESPENRPERRPENAASHHAVRNRVEPMEAAS